jgi:hypothetical protein
MLRLTISPSSYGSFIIRESQQPFFFDLNGGSLCTTSRLYSLYDATISDWEIILDLAVRWEFPQVKDLAVRELEKKEIPDSKRIKLYHANKVDKNILIPRYAALCEREAPLTIEEAEDIGMITTVLIARGREEARASCVSAGVRSPIMPTTRGVALYDIIRDVFHILPPSSTQNPDTTGGLVTLFYKLS